VAVGSTLYLAASVQGVPTLFSLNDGAASWSATPVNAALTYYPARVVLGLVGGVPHLALKSSMSEAIHTYRASGGVSRLGPDLPASMSTSLEAMLDVGGEPVVQTISSSSDDGTSEESSANRLTGGVWVNIAGPNLPRAKAGAMAVVNGNLVVALFQRGATLLQNDTLKVFKWTGATWTEVDSYTSPDDTALAGTPVVAARGSTLGIIWDTPPSAESGFRIAWRNVTIP
jgi:hypothetical protein